MSCHNSKETPVSQNNLQLTLLFLAIQHLFIQERKGKTCTTNEKNKQKLVDNLRKGKTHTLTCLMIIYLTTQLSATSAPLSKN